MSTDIHFTLFELMIAILFIICTAEAWRRKNLGELISALLFGMCLELVDTSFFSAYQYGHFNFSIKNVPLCIGLAWAVILYASMSLSDCWKFSILPTICLDVLLALAIDLMMDPIAIRLGMWHWSTFLPADQWSGGWFGVPYANFYGWIVAVGSFSLFARWFRYSARSKAILSIFIFLPSELMLFGALHLPLSNHQAIVVGLLLFSVICVMIAMIRLRGRAIKPAASMMLVALSIQLFFMACLFTPLLSSNANILLVSGVMLVLMASHDILLLHFSKR